MLKRNTLLIVVLALLSCNGIPASESADANLDAALRFWLENMALHHGYTPAEMAPVLKMPEADIPGLLKKYKIDPTRKPPAKDPDRVKVLPYPGGRHPRIGFLEGAINPERGTKASVFLPWRPSDYVVVDIPEAIWANNELIYLAHTHIPTRWDRKHIKLKPQDWVRQSGRVLTLHRTLPNKVAFKCRITPRKDRVDMTLHLINGSQETLRNIKIQICVLLKKAGGFNGQIGGNKKSFERGIAVKAKDGDRWIATAWDLGKPWQNPDCPCMHSDPVCAILKPGDTMTTRGVLFFHEGKDVAAAMAKQVKMLAARDKD